MSEYTEPSLFDPIETLPVQPYGDLGDTETDGYTGVPTRAYLKGNQLKTMNVLRRNGTYGATWVDLAEEFRWHHGTASACLSVLHKAGVVNRLKEKRDGSSLYVLTEHTNERETIAHRPNASARLLVSILRDIETDLREGRTWEAVHRIEQTRATFGDTDAVGGA